MSRNPVHLTDAKLAALAQYPEAVAAVPELAGLKARGCGCGREATARMDAARRAVFALPDGPFGTVMGLLAADRLVGYVPGDGGVPRQVERDLPRPGG